MTELRRTAHNDRVAQFDLIVDGQPVGMCQVRRRTSHAAGIPAEAASHFYFEVQPEFRGRRYGKRMLALALIEARRMGLDEIIVTAREDNAASRGAIEGNGGRLTAILPCADGARICRYVFDLAGLDSDFIASFTGEV